MERSNDDHSRTEDFKGVESLVSFDPTPRHEYLDWICRTYVGQSFLLEDASRVFDTLTVFHRYKHRLPVAQRDIGLLKSEQDLWELVERFTPQNGEEEPAEGKELKRQEKAKALSESDILESEDLDGWTVASPKTHFAARWWSKGTRWCTGMKKPAYFNNYVRSGPLRVFISPSGEKLQAHVATLTFCDAADRRLSNNAFLDQIPAPALKMLQDDAIRSMDKLGIFSRIPAPLRSESMIEKAKQEGFDQAVTLAENSDGYLLKYLPSMLSMWAFGLISENEFGRGGQRADVILMRAETVLAHYYDSSNGATLCDQIKNTTDVDFIRKCASSMLCLWERNNNFPNKFVNVIGKAFADEYFDQATWDAYFAKAAKKLRNNNDLTIPVAERYISDEMADALAKYNLLTILPQSMITPERVDIFVADTPENISRVAYHGHEHMISDEAIATAAKWKKGKGLAYVPYERLSQELFHSVVKEHPTAIYHADQRHLTHELIDYVVSIVPSAIINIPERFVTEELVLKAISINGSLFQQLNQKWKTQAVTELALRVSPNVFVNTDCYLTYEQFRNGVAIVGSSLSRVPLIYRTIEMCEAALLAHVADAVAHVPPRVLAAIKERRDSNPDSPLKTHTSGWNRPLSKRYAPNDPIHSFFPDDDTVLPERLQKLMHADKVTAISTDPDGLLARQLVDAPMTMAM